MRITYGIDAEGEDVRIVRDGCGRMAWTLYKRPEIVSFTEWEPWSMYDTRGEALADYDVTVTHTVTV